MSPSLDLPKRPVGVDFKRAATTGAECKLDGTVYHGMPKKLLRPVPTDPSYLAFLGRSSAEKRVDRAIHIAERCGLPLKIAAKVDAVDQDYFEEMIKPLLAKPHVEFIGEITDAQKSEFLSNEFALLVPIDWPEPLDWS